MELTKKLVNQAKLQGYEKMYLCGFAEMGSPKVAGIFRKNAQDYFLKIAGENRLDRILREWTILKNITKANIRTGKIPRLISIHRDERFALFTQEFFKSYKKIWGIEELHATFFKKIFSEFINIRRNIFPENLPKINNDTKKLKDLLDYYYEELVEIEILDEGFRNKYSKLLREIDPIEEKIKITLTHNDLNGNNILYNKESCEYAIVDWERADFSPLIYDIGRSIVFSAFHWSIKNESNITYPEKSKLYEELTGLINEKEKKILGLYFLLDSLKRYRFYKRLMRESENYEKSIEICKEFIKHQYFKIKNG